MQDGTESKDSENQASTIKAALEPLQENDAHREFFQFLNLLFLPSEESEEILEEFAPQIIATIENIMRENSAFSQCLLEIWPEQLTKIGAQKSPPPIEEEENSNKFEKPQDRYSPKITRSHSSSENLNFFIGGQNFNLSMTEKTDLKPLDPSLPTRFPSFKSAEVKTLPTSPRERAAPKRLSAISSYETPSTSPSESPRETPYSPDSGSPIHCLRPETPREPFQSPREQVNNPAQHSNNPSSNRVRLERPIKSSAVSVQVSASRYSQSRSALKISEHRPTKEITPSSPIEESLCFKQFSPPKEGEKSPETERFVRPSRQQAFFRYTPTGENQRNNGPQNPSHPPRTLEPDTSNPLKAESTLWEMTFTEKSETGIPSKNTLRK